MQKKFFFLFLATPCIFWVQLNQSLLTILKVRIRFSPSYVGGLTETYVHVLCISELYATLGPVANSVADIRLRLRQGTYIIW